MLKKAIFAAVVFMAFAAIPAYATSLYVTKKKPEAGQQEVVPPPSANVFKNSQQHHQPAQGAQKPERPVCTEKDAKLFMEIHNYFASMHDDVAKDPEKDKDKIQKSHERIKQLKESFDTPEKVQNFIMLYYRCAPEVGKQLKAAGLQNPGQTSKNR